MSKMSDQAIMPQKVMSLSRSTMALGIIMMVLGALAIIYTGVATVASLLMIGWVLIVAGGLGIINAIRLRKEHGLFMHLLAGIVSLVTGLIIVTKPATSALTLTLLMAGYFIGSGAFRIAVSLVERFRSWGWSVLAGLASIALGVMIWLGWPEISFVVIDLFVGIDLLFYGTSLSALGVAFRRFAKRIEPRPAQQALT